MKKFGVVFLLLIALSMNFVTSQTFEGIETLSFKQIECMTILPFKNEIIGQEIPKDIPISDEIINVFIGKEIYGYFKVEEKIITDFDCSKNELATYDLFIVGEKTISDIILSENPQNTFLEKFKNKEIELKGKTLGRKIKAFFVKIGIKWFM